MNRLTFCGYPSAFLYAQADAKSPVKKQFLWGDTLSMLATQSKNGFLNVSSRDETGWIRKENVQSQQLLDMIFVDVGQGDGCLIVTPHDERIIVDAGQEDNMYRYLRWRYKDWQAEGSEKMAKFKAAVISHPDSDHFRGFNDIFDQSFIQVDALYHNGLFERKGKGISALGPTKKVGKQKYVTDLLVDKPALKRFFDAETGKMPEFAEFIRKVQASRPGIDIRMLSAADSYLPGVTATPGLSIRVLGPVTEPDPAGAPMLQVFENVGKTKNGHSIILLIQYQQVRILLGGDLNIPAEKYLLEKYGLGGVQAQFHADVVKAYHHGSSDFDARFIQALQPVVTVISSGDNESYSHPRADTLGFLGRWSRSDRPLIFSTELARSSTEIVKHPNILKKEYQDCLKVLSDPQADAAGKRKAQKRCEELGNKLINRSVAVFGAINLRTDGKRLVMAQKREKKDTLHREWDIYQLEAPGLGTQLCYLVP